MVKAESFSYHLGKTIDLKKAQKKAGGNILGNILEIKVDELEVHVFQSGRIRLSVPGKTFNELQEAMLSNAMRISSIIQKIGGKVDVQKVMKTGKQDDPEDYDTSAIEGKGLVSSEVVRGIISSAYRVSQDFQVERIMTQAGETVGRKLVKQKNPKNRAMLVKEIKEYVEKEGFGRIEEGEKRKLVDIVFKVYGCPFAAGAPNINKKVCNFTRGILRGAFAEFKGAETISVKETKCWAKGDPYCEFEVYSLAA